MKTWWTQRSSREQLLLVLAGIILATVFVIQVVVVPSMAARNAAAASLAQAQSTLLRLERLNQAGAAYTEPSTAVSASGATDLAADWATQSGLVRTGADLSGQSLDFAFAPTEPASVFAWTERVERELGFRVDSAELIAAGNGQVQARIVLAREPAQ